MIKSEEIRISGIVQGVGFRPTVWRLANECGLSGRVWNDAGGVSVEVWGEAEAIDLFVARIQSEQPYLARVDEVLRTVVDGSDQAPIGFQIIHSRGGEVRSGVTADAATCQECIQEVLNPDDRRYGYPFTNCTHCGPRLSIISSIPYDRANTSMANFRMCEQCLHEYEDPADRRFHAQPNACPECGPHLWLEDAAGNRVEPPEGAGVIQAAAALLKGGSIVAIKGIGGIHLACDAANEEAVDRLRRRKHRYHKALAIMAADIPMVSRFARVDPAEAELLEDKASPIVILDAVGEALADGIAPGQDTLGFMLPYTPLHHLLMQEMERPVVMTSGNRSEEPQSIENREAHARLGQIADYYLRLPTTYRVNRLLPLSGSSADLVLTGTHRHQFTASQQNQPLILIFVWQHLALAGNGRHQVFVCTRREHNENMSLSMERRVICLRLRSRTGRHTAHHINVIARNRHFSIKSSSGITRNTGM